MELPSVSFSTSILAVIVTFHPAPEGLMELLFALTPQVDGVVIIDNTPEGADWNGRLSKVAAMPNVRIRVLGENRGIAAAQNIGINIGLAEQFDHVLFSDQDSVPAPDMVSRLLALARDRLAAGVQVGSVSPAYYDQTTRQSFRFQVQPPGSLFYRSVPAKEARPWLELVTTISSGSLVPVEALKAIGGMREDFFIDDVDTEWCHRASAHGFHHFGTDEARLMHRLGDNPFRVWYFGWREHSEYPASRLYYRFRNFVRMVTLPHVPLRWSVRASWYWAGNVYAYSLFARNRLVNIRAIALGVWDGLLGRAGVLRRKL